MFPNAVTTYKEGLLHVGASTSLPLLLLIDQVSSESVCPFAKMNLSPTNRSVKVQITIPKATVHAYGICVTKKQAFDFARHLKTSFYSEFDFIVSMPLNNHPGFSNFNAKSGIGF